MEPLVVLAIATITIVVLFAGRLLLQRSVVDLTLEEKVRLLPAKQEVDDGRSDHWMASATDTHDQRRTPRRKGNLTPILVTTPADYPVKSSNAFVIDRSSEGLCLAIEKPFEIGEMIYVSPIDSTWVSAKVRNCRHSDGLFLIGCQFLEPVPWDVLLRFG